MQIVKPSARMLHPDHDGEFSLGDGIGLLQRIEARARVSHRSEDKVTPDSWKRLILSVVLNHGDWSVTEHESVTVEAVVDRGITHEWVRHRIGAYTQESTRFVNYGKHKQFDGNIAVIAPEGLSPAQQDHWETSIRHATRDYISALQLGMSPEIARDLLPHATAAKILVTYNLRNWRHFFLMRTSKETHPKFRQVTIPLLKEFQDKIPLLYDDIVPKGRQIANLNTHR